VLLVEEEDSRVVGGAVGLIEETAGLLARERRHYLENLAHLLLFPGFDPIRRSDHVRHLSAPLVTSPARSRPSGCSLTRGYRIPLAHARSPNASRRRTEASGRRRPCR